MSNQKDFERNASPYTADFDIVHDLEKQRIERIREKRRAVFEDLPKDADYSGLALSGGGIRSAAFGLGVMHALQNRRILRRIDYLSTVSGGGYIGSTLSFLEHHRVTSTPDEGKADVPVGKMLGTRRIGEKSGDQAARSNRILNHIRQHGNYITQGPKLGYFSVVAMVLRAIVVGLLVWLPLTAVALLVLNFASSFVAWATSLPAALPGSALAGSLNLLAFLAIGVASIFGIYSACTCSQKNRAASDDAYTRRVRQQRWLGRCLRTIVALLVLASLPYALEALVWLQNSMRESPAETLQTGGATIAAVGGILGGSMAFFLNPAGNAKGDAGGRSMSFPAAVGGALMLYAGMLLAIAVGDGVASFVAGSNTLVAIAVFVAVAVPLWFASRTNLNVVSLHRLYRDRLMETFLPDPSLAGRWHKARDAEKTWLDEVSSGETVGPYHLLNTNVILTNSKKTACAGRGGDSFVLAPLYSGSDATGWANTRQWANFAEAGKSSDRLSLPTAMAISGAAVNPHSGPSGGGATRNALVSVAMALANLRLSCWLPRPRKDPPGVAPTATWLKLAWQFFRGRGHREDGDLVELSDGGHFENLGLYELVRRRVKFIIAADAGCDPQSSFADLGNALERCRVDFGVDIRFADEAFDLRHLIPLTSDATPFAKVVPLAQRGVAVAQIRYPDEKDPNGAPAEIGHLIYIKTTLTEHLPADVYAYKKTNPGFPDQTTGDQWFDEAQFEAYRELGYALVENFLDEFAKSAPARAAADRRGGPHAALIGWLHGHVQPPAESKVA